MEQRSTEWFMQRLGHLSGSRINDALTFLAKGGESEKRIQLRYELASERMTGLPTPSYTNGAMQWGIDTESLARGAYEAEKGVMVDEVGFIKHPSIEWAGASPDGLIQGGLIEIKCPASTTHIKYLTAGVVPSQYKPQMLWQMACTKREWCDFVSYDPRMPEDLQLFITRFEPLNSELAEIEEKAEQFLQTVDELVTQLELIAVERYRANPNFVSNSNVSISK